MNPATSRSTAAARTYLHQTVMTASPEKLVVLLYDNALRQMETARVGIENKEVARAGEALSKAFAIVSELRTSLDPEKGGEIAENLDRLYDFIQDRLVKANRERSLESMDEAIKIFKVLKEGWDGIFRAP